MIWNLGKFTPYGECYPRDLFRQIVSISGKGATAARPEEDGSFFIQRMKRTEDA